MYLKENLKWDVRVKHLASTCYGTLANLRKIENFTTFNLRKHLAESLIISRLDFSDIAVFYPLTEHLLERLQRIQYSAASFVTGRYVNSIESILKLSWSPMREGTAWHILKAAHKALYSSDWPLYVSLAKSERTRVLRSNADVNLVLPLVSNSVPADIKSCTDHRAFPGQTFNILKQRCLTIVILSSRFTNFLLFP